jgi:hypothetical protein
MQLMTAPPPTEEVISQRRSVRYFHSPKDHFSVPTSQVFHFCDTYGVCNYGTIWCV